MYGSSNFNRGGGRGRHDQNRNLLVNATSLERVEAAVAKAKSDLLSRGENVSTWKLSQSAVVYLQARSWDSVGFRFNEVPSLRNLQFVEGKVNAFIHCFVSTRRMTSVHELGIELCQSEGVEQFDELGLGPLLRHPLVQHYFCVPPDATEVCKITVEDLIGRLTVFQYKMKYKEFAVEEFLDFLVQKYSVDSREKLGVRIQSMGMYIRFIRKIKKAEDAAQKSIQESGMPKEEPQEPSASIPEHLKAVSTLIEDYDEKHNITTGTLKDDNDDNAIASLHSRKGNKQRHNSKKSLDDVDDMKLIGLKLAMFNYHNCGRKPPENEDLGNLGGPRYEIIQTNSAKAMKLTLTNYELERFIVSWKGACQKHAVNEVLAMMLHVYKTTDKQRRKMERLFLSFPAVGLLNIAVRFIKFGEPSSLIQGLKENVSPNPSSKANIGRVDQRHSTEGDQAAADENCTIEVRNDVSVDDIITQVASYFGLDHLVPRKKDQAMKQHAAVCDCEIWLNKKFSVKDFKCLGYGCFVEFLQTHASFLPHELQFLISGVIHMKSSLEASMLQQQFRAFICQAARSMRDNSVVTGQYISILLKKQFPSIGFQLLRNEPEGSFQELVKDQGDFDIPMSVTYSIALLGNSDDSLYVPREEFGVEPSRMQYESVGAFGSVSSTDAIQCLLRVPMLSDLQLWSHWDLLFAPSLGSLLEWLLGMGHIKELSCVVTRDGRIIRIDPLATLDEFFEASVLGLPFQAAVKLLSLFFVYGGLHNIPVALLKCYCQRAFDVTIKNYAHKGNEHGENIVQHGYSQGSIPCANEGRTPLHDLHCVGMEHQVNRRLSEDLSQINKAHAVIAMFVMECLGHLPSEFCSTAADILVSSFQLFSKDAALIMLCVSKTTDARIMLHDIGLSLGITEWVNDYREFSSPLAADPSTLSGTLRRQYEHVTNLKSILNMSNLFSTDGKVTAAIEADSTIVDDREFHEAEKTIDYKEISCKFDHCIGSSMPTIQEIDDATSLIQKIRLEEFGLGPNLKNSESSLLKKQHARLGRALHCLSRELYSQDSHFILELVQNADDNIYPENVAATIVFILQDAAVVVLNNEEGFTAQNIRALCDVGSSTKKGSGAGYIGKKGIGFKSVFRVSDAPEIHSNGFHIKFDITEGQIGFVLPTIISPCNIDLYRKQVFCDSDQSDATSWNTCIVLPFNLKIKRSTGISPIISMFSDLHPSLLLFLQRLRCIKVKNMLEDKLVTMRREILKDGIIKVSHGETQMYWLVVDKTMKASFIRPDVQTTKIAIAFTLQDCGNGDYMPDLDQQPVFAFLPLRNYGLKFILQGDFVLPSSREEVEGDSAWNQWLLSEFPDLFVSAEKSFCMLSCYQESPGRAVSAFMSFVPLIGEVHGFFSQLPNVILSKLRLSNCLLLDGSNVDWVRPCRVLRNWNEQVRNFLPETVLQQHLGLGYLSKDINLSDSLARALGIKEYGPKFLVELLSSICNFSDGIKLFGLHWLSSWLDALYTSLSSSFVHSYGYLSHAAGGSELDLLNGLRQISFIPLSDGSYGSLAKGPIWLPFCAFSSKYEGENRLKEFPGLYAKLRTVHPLLFSPETTEIESIKETTVTNATRMLCKIGVQQLSAHDVMINHVLPSISADKNTNEDASLMIEYLSFIMTHLQSACCNCNTERNGIICEMQKKAVVLTNNGYKCPIEETIHFSGEFGNTINVKKLVDNTGIKWNEVDNIYLKHPSSLSFSVRLSWWRSFFQELGVTDFVQVVHVERNVVDVLYSEVSKISSIGNVVPSELFIKDWESPELVYILCALSSNKSSDTGKYLLEVLDNMWDDFFGPKAKCFVPFQSNEEKLAFDSSLMKTIHKFKWVASSIDDDVHYPKDLFYDCESVRSILGVLAPYAVPKVTSKSFLDDVQFKVQVTLNDALTVIQHWRDSEVSASISQMSKFYTFVRDELSSSRERITEVRTSISIFIPLVQTSNYMDVLPGRFMHPEKTFWHDPTGCLDRLQEAYDEHSSTSDIGSPPCMPLANLYPGLHDFLVTDCGVLEILPSCSYLRILLQLSRINLPSQAAHEVFQVFLRWADDFKSGLMNSGEILGLKESLVKLENTVLPTVQDKWVSLHPQFGLVCWSDDGELMEQCMHLNDVYFLQFGELTVLEKEMLSSKVAALMENVGIRTLTEVVSREAIFYGIEDNTEVASLINWALPYVQRYLYKLHPNAYIYPKHCGFGKLMQLHVVVVEKLFYSYSINGRSATNRKRHECSCLLEGNTFYVTRNVDSHLMFLELSRFFFHGIPELHMANFLYMVTNMAELGSTADQIEFFIVSIQGVPVLPAGEPLWSLSSLFTHNASEFSSPTYSHLLMSKKQYLKPAKTQFTRTNWPPTNWKSAPDFPSPSNVHVIEKPGDSPTIRHHENRPIPSETGMKDDSITTEVGKEVHAGPMKGDFGMAEAGKEMVMGSTFVCEKVHGEPLTITECHPTYSSIFTERDKLCLGVPKEDQSYNTGRFGEMVVYKYFMEKLGPETEVQWVNKEAETGLPYDLIIGYRGSMEYVEVKSTTSATKDWFQISANEFHFASEKGDSFSIARVILSSSTNAEISFFKNPVKLCRENMLHLAVLLQPS